MQRPPPLLQLPLPLPSQHLSQQHLSRPRLVNQLLERQRDLRPEDEFFQRKRSTPLYLNCSRYVLLLFKSLTTRSLICIPCIPLTQRIIHFQIHRNIKVLVLPWAETFPIEPTIGPPNVIGMTKQFGNAVSETDIDDHCNSIRRNQYRATLLYIMIHCRNIMVLVILSSTRHYVCIAVAEGKFKKFRYQTGQRPGKIVHVTGWSCLRSLPRCSSLPCPVYFAAAVLLEPERISKPGKPSTRMQQL